MHEQHEHEIPVRIDTPEIAIVNDAHEPTEATEVPTDNEGMTFNKHLDQVVKVDYTLNSAQFDCMLTGYRTHGMFICHP